MTQPGQFIHRDGVLSLHVDLVLAQRAVSEAFERPASAVGVAERESGLGHHHDGRFTIAAAGLHIDPLLRNPTSVPAHQPRGGAFTLQGIEAGGFDLDGVNGPRDALGRRTFYRLRARHRTAGFVLLLAPEIQGAGRAETKWQHVYNSSSAVRASAGPQNVSDD
jgi:hypothetical protein